MLRVALTGNLGSGKSTAAARFAAHGAHVISSDAIGRDLMQPGQSVFQNIVSHFGPEVLSNNGTLDRATLATIAFAQGRAEELNAIVHPAVIAHQAELAANLSAREPNAVLIVESALIFETKFAAQASPGQPQTRFDRIVLVTAPEQEKIARFLHRQYGDGLPTPAQRHGLEAEARRRLALQMPDALKAPQCDHLLINDGSLLHLEDQVDALWPTLRHEAERQP